MIGPVRDPQRRQRPLRRIGQRGARIVGQARRPGLRLRRAQAGQQGTGTEPGSAFKPFVYAAALEAAGNRVRLHEVAGALHGFITLPRRARAPREALGVMTAFLDDGPPG